MPVALYLRVSTEEQRERQSIAGMEIKKELIDELLKNECRLSLKQAPYLSPEPAHLPAAVTIKSVIVSRRKLEIS